LDFGAVEIPHLMNKRILECVYFHTDDFAARGDLGPSSCSMLSLSSG
jgi:hypothetical protein